MLKQLVKNLIKKVPFALSKNHGYDLYTKRIIKQVCKPASSCVDVGCHKGEILDLMRSAAPQGTHFAFEPLPHLYSDLSVKYAKIPQVKLYQVALSEQNGTTEYNHVITNPAYSGIKKRSYDKASEQDEKLTVEMKTLDDCIPNDIQIDLIKIDIEGGEYDMLKGASKTLERCHPTLIFEHGLGASDAYGTQPRELYNYLTEKGYQINLLNRYLKSQKALTEAQFEEQYYQRINYYFIASTRD